MEEENSDNSDLQYKILLLGPSGAGKTSLLLQYSDNIFENVSPTVGVDVRYKYITYNYKKIKLDIWDTAGQERYNSVTNSCLNGANAIILVYEKTKKESFDKLKNWFNNNKNNIPKDTEIMLVENKEDIKEEEREVSKEDIEAFENENNLKVYYTSAKTGNGIEKMFMDLINNLLKNKNIGKMNPEDDGEDSSSKKSFRLKKNNNNNSNKCCCSK